MVNYCKSSKCLVGKTAIITGANSGKDCFIVKRNHIDRRTKGIGYETALDFAKRGCRVILACRDYEKASEARHKIAALTGNENVIVKIVDMESLDSVRDFAKVINTSEERLDILVNNAGAMDLPDKITKDGLQLEMAVNYFAHFLLTNLLLDLLKKSAPSRVVNVSSSLAMIVRNLNLEQLNKHEGNLYLYAKTKLCNIYFTQELARRIEGTGVTTYSLHPGAIHTQFQRSSIILNLVASVCFKTPEEGAQTTIYVSLEDGIEKYNGQHFEDCKPVKPYCAARDEKKAKQLWEISEQMVGLK